jgi:hypothetical protein
MEECVGCGSKSGRHPIVGIAHRGDVEGDRIAENGDYVAHPVCGECWRKPTRRRPGLKLHFFWRDDMHAALEHAGSESIG